MFSRAVHADLIVAVGGVSVSERNGLNQIFLGPRLPIYVINRHPQTGRLAFDYTILDVLDETSVLRRLDT